MMDTKALGRVEIKDADKGTVKAVFSTFDVIDHDGDVTAPGAIEDGALVRISAYGHASWGGALPVGKGVVRIKGSEAILEGQFFMDTTHGRDTFETVKQLSEDGLQEWSYGFDVLDAEPVERDGRSVRLLKRLKVHEVSPVLLGAGINTRTLAAKSHTPRPATPDGRVPAVKRAIPTHDTPTVARAWDAAGTVAALPEGARPSELRSVYAWVDPDGDPETKSSYRFPHHHGVGGPANIRACLAGIAVLNGARGGADVPDEDREAIYKHLAAHLTDADREPPELRTAPAGTRKNLRFVDESADVMASVSGLIDRAQEVMALRARKGRGMSPVTADLLSWVGDDLKRLQRLLEHPIEDDQPTVSEDEIASTLMAAIARVNGI
ncbi:HK97 family phage prohead protease [Streptomyces sp. NPDC012888]|uniref:HK97 family phage prohead protease n=1 Tax=Streptomyces sp. NPDC012888 TaxID=3364855 RepID=UPI003676A677